MKAVGTCGHDKNDNYPREEDRRRERNDKEVRKAFCSMESFTGLTKCKRKKMGLSSAVSLGAEMFRIICCRLQPLKLHVLRLYLSLQAQQGRARPDPNRNLH
jgi:hypothetical protein